MAGKVFFLAKSPDAPRTTMTVASVKRLPEDDMEGIDPRLELERTRDILFGEGVGRRGVGEFRVDERVYFVVGKKP